MDQVSRAVLNKIYALGGVGRYFIISAEEFFDSFPEDSARDDGALKDALKELQRTGYIDMRYSGGDMYCVALLKAYEPEPTPPPPTCERPEVLPPQPAINIRAVFWAAFLGGAAGGFCTALIATLIAIFA